MQIHNTFIVRRCFRPAACDASYRFEDALFATVSKASFLTSHKACNTKSVQTVESNVDNMNASSICKPLGADTVSTYPVAKPEAFIVIM